MTKACRSPAATPTVQELCSGRNTCCRPLRKASAHEAIRDQDQVVEIPRFRLPSRRIGKDVRHTRCSNYMALRKGPIISSLFVLVKALPRQREGAISKLSCCRPSSPSSGLIQMLIISVGLFQSDRYLVDGTDHVACDQAHLSNDGFEALSF
jgi:hypothetical protein